MDRALGPLIVSPRSHQVLPYGMCLGIRKPRTQAFFLRADAPSIRPWELRHSGEESDESGPGPYRLLPCANLGTVSLAKSLPSPLGLSESPDE